MRRHPDAAMLGACLALSAGLLLKTWLHPASQVVGGAGDPQAEAWLLTWVPFAVSHLHNPFLTDHLNFPAGANLMWFSAPLPGFLMWPITAAAGALVGYNLLVTLALGLSAWCMYLALGRIVGPGVGAAVGGVFYGFSPYLTGHAVAHASVVLAVTPPLLLLVLHEALVRQRWRPWRSGAALGLLGAAQLMTFPETLAAELIAALVGLTLLAAVNRGRARPHLPHAGRAVLGGAVTFLVVAGPALLIMLAGPQRLSGGSVRPPGVYVADLLNLVVPTELTLVSPAAGRALTGRFTGNITEWTAYLGAPLIVLLGVTTVRLWSNRTVRVAALGAVVMAVLSLGPTLHVAGADTHVPLPWRLFEQLPLITNLLPARLALLTGCFAAVVLAVAVEWISHLRAERARAAGVIAVAVALIALLPAMPFPSASVTVPSFFVTADVRRIPEGSSVLVAPYTINGGSDDPELWQALSGMRFRMPSGYVFVPTATGPGNDLTPLAEAMLTIPQRGTTVALTFERRRQFAGDLRRLEVHTVIVGPMAHRDTMVRFLAELLGGPPDRVGGVEVWWNPRVAL